MTYGYRDPRDMILSARDHNLRSAADGSDEVFVGFKSYSKAINHARYWAGQSLLNVKNGLLHTYRYEDIVGSPVDELRRLARYLELEISDELIHLIVEEERANRSMGVNELNKAVLTRFRDEMEPELLEQCHRLLGGVISRLGYEVPITKVDESIDKALQGDDCSYIDLCDVEDSQLINFYEPEVYRYKLFRWSKSVSSIWVELKKEDYWCRIDTYSFRRSLQNDGVAIYVNDQCLPAENIRLGVRFIDFLVLSANIKVSRMQLLTFTVHPSSVSSDERELGIPMGRLELRTWSKQEWGEPAQAKRKLRHRFTKRKKLPDPVLPVWEQREFEEVVCAGFSRALPIVERLIVAQSEVNNRHGTGILIKHFFPNITDYGVLLTGRHHGGESAVNRYPIDYLGTALTPRHKVYAKVLECFAHHPPRQVYVVPFCDKDFHIAIALKDIFQCEICIHVMDDNHFFGGMVAESLLAEALSKADIVFGISPELVDAYNAKFNEGVKYFPPLIQGDWIGMSTEHPLAAMERPVMIGNVWSGEWLKRLMDLLIQTEVKVDWYANNPESRQVQQYIDSMEAHGLYRHDPRPETELLQQDFGGRLYTLVPTGPLDGADDPAEKLARLSLPSRVILLVAGGNLPVLVVGSRETAVARFVLKHDLGCVVPYELAVFKQGVATVTDPEHNARFRANAKGIASRFSCSGIEDWIWGSASQQGPADDRFERMMRGE